MCLYFGQVYSEISSDDVILSLPYACSIWAGTMWRYFRDRLTGVCGSVFIGISVYPILEKGSWSEPYLGDDCTVLQKLV